MCFIQLKKQRSSNVLPVDKIDQCLQCVSLKCERNACKAGQLSSGKKYGFDSVESIRAVICVLEKQTGLHLVHHTHP